MSDKIEFEGIITTECGNARFIVEVPGAKENTKIFCTLGAKIKLNNIKVIPGDKVKIEVSPYDLTKGRITYRCK